MGIIQEEVKEWNDTLAQDAPAWCGPPWQPIDVASKIIGTTVPSSSYPADLLVLESVCGMAACLHYKGYTATLRGGGSGLNSYIKDAIDQRIRKRYDLIPVATAVNPNGGIGIAEVMTKKKDTHPSH